MTIYVDLYFIFNFATDLLVLMLCRRILGYRRSLTRLLLSAGIGAFYAVAVLPFPHPGIWLLHLAFGALLPLIACGFGSLRRFLRLLLYFFGISFFLGGAITAFLRGLAIFLAAGSGLHLTLSLILFAALAGGCFCLFFGNVTRSAPGKHAVTVTLRNGDRRLCFQGYADTGNLLREPIENLPVILANASLSQRIFSFCSNAPSPNRTNCDDPAHYAGLPFRLVPCRTVTGSSVLPALKFDAEIDGQMTAVCIALQFKRPSDYCGFDALVPAELLSSPAR